MIAPLIDIRILEEFLTIFSNQIKKSGLHETGLVRRFAGSGLDTILLPDEKLFTIEQAYNRQNHRILSPSLPLKVR